MTMNLASGSGTSYVDFSCATHAAFIVRLGVDVVFLQEVDRLTRRAGGIDQLAALRDATGLSESHFVLWQNIEGGEYGVAIISRLPLITIENRSVLKPWHWWPFFVRQVVTPVAYAQISVAGKTLDLYATHFPSSNESRKQYGAEELAAAIPRSEYVVFGGDFNDGPGGVAMRSIDQRFSPAASVAAEVRVADEPIGVTFGDGIIDRGLDHIYLANGISCRLWTTTFPVQAGRQFSDHPICIADLELPRPAVLRLLQTAISPFPTPFNVATTVTVTAIDAASGVSVVGSVLVDDLAVGSTGVPFALHSATSSGQKLQP